MVALTGIERAKVRFSSVQLGLSECKHVQLVRRDLPERRHKVLACQRGASAVTSGWTTCHIPGVRVPRASRTTLEYGRQASNLIHYLVNTHTYIWQPSRASLWHRGERCALPCTDQVLF